jgi:hypothetical protein
MAWPVGRDGGCTVAQVLRPGLADALGGRPDRFDAGAAVHRGCSILNARAPGCEVVGGERAGDGLSGTPIAGSGARPLPSFPRPIRDLPGRPKWISIHELIHELLATHASTAHFGARCAR